MLGTGTDIVPNVPNFSVPVRTTYRRYRSPRYGYEHHTERTELLGTGTDYRTGTTGTGTNCVPNVPKISVPVRASYRMYRTSRYRYRHRTELTKLLGMVWKPIPVPVPVIPAIPAVCVRSVSHIARPKCQFQNARRGKTKIFVCVRATLKPLNETKQKISININTVLIL